MPESTPGTTHRYHITYDVVRDGLSPEEMRKRHEETGVGAADALVVLSVIYPPDGSLSLNVLNVDGRTAGPLDSGELFKLTTMLLGMLAQDTELAEPFRHLAEHFVGSVRLMMFAARDPLAMLVPPGAAEQQPS